MAFITTASHPTRGSADRSHYVMGNASLVIVAMKEDSSRSRRLHILHVKGGSRFQGRIVDCLPDRGRHRKDRQIHCDHDKSDGDTQEHHHHRLQEGGEIRHGLVHLILIEIGDFPKHAIQRAR